ncbi:hypothetical protein B9T31_04035 [Acinetobacter sp. ANC 4558]|uniref:hypothetical protein n=1 Tax=Acinetobacter sp. ANC 4558 TaxID=1977876 RepID=UPI000A32FF5A|nr:hypothetical protein [Acinetobacter sp. ANC 4558]OTG87674.1 hypothetical protein B9T31_04035 [Acinetobacter sp. ANC 4558]
MNNKVKANASAQNFVANDRIRLFVECNKFKQLAKDSEVELSKTQARSKQVISTLLLLNIILIGGLIYVLQRT